MESNHIAQLTNNKMEEEVFKLGERVYVVHERCGGQLNSVVVIEGVLISMEESILEIGNAIDSIASKNTILENMNTSKTLGVYRLDGHYYYRKNSKYVFHKKEDAEVYRKKLNLELNTELLEYLYNTDEEKL